VARRRAGHRDPWRDIHAPLARLVRIDVWRPSPGTTATRPARRPTGVGPVGGRPAPSSGRREAGVGCACAVVVGESIGVRRGRGPCDLRGQCAVWTRSQPRLARPTPIRDLGWVLPITTTQSHWGSSGRLVASNLAGSPGRPKVSRLTSRAPFSRPERAGRGSHGAIRPRGPGPRQPFSPPRRYGSPCPVSTSPTARAPTAGRRRCATSPSSTAGTSTRRSVSGSAPGSASATSRSPSRPSASSSGEPTGSSGPSSRAWASTTPSTRARRSKTPGRP
jgi:hypothetical protein